VIVVEAKFVGGGHVSALSQLFRKQTAVVGTVWRSLTGNNDGLTMVVHNLY
jgi:hypothetical protein